MNKPLPGILIVAAMCLLAACGEHGAAQKPLGAAAQNSAQANSTMPCAYVVGQPGKHNADLFVAAGNGDVHRVEQALVAGERFNATDSLKRTPLFAAAFCNRTAAANLLIDKGGDVNARDFIGLSPLHAAVIVGGSETAKALILRGANINMQNATGRTPLHLAAATNQGAMVDMLMERGADAQIPDKNGVAATALALNNGHPAVAAAIEKWQEKNKTAIQQ